MNRKEILTVVLVTVLAFTSILAASPQTKASKTPAAPQAAKGTEQIDLNTATKQQLMTLTGIGDALAQKIIDNRPYRAKNELTQKKIIPQATYDKIADQIIARQPAGSKGGEKKGSTAPKKP